MRARQFLASTVNKFQLPATWGVILIYGGTWAGVRLLVDVPQLFSPWAEFLIPFVGVAAQVALAPLPWLWTGDDRPRTPPLRGLLQAFPWNLFWTGLLVGALFLVNPHTCGSPPQVRLHLPGGSVFLRPQWGLFMLNLPLALILGWFLAEKECAETAERELRSLAGEARAQALQAQLNPHVLFNILGGLAELVHEDPDAAEQALVDLTGLYRHLTRHGAAMTASLRNERDLLERYLEIEEMRLGRRLEQAWEWPAWADDLELPPLLLQPLVENAIKHGIAPETEGGILRVAVTRGPACLVLSVANTGKPLEPGHRDGTGLGNLRQRLELLPQLRPGFELVQDGAWTVARLTLAWRWPS